MKKLTYVILLVLGISGMFYTSSPTAAAEDAATVTGAARGVFGAGAAINSVAVQSFDLGTGVFIEPDGSASGPFNAVLSGRSVLGQAQQITIDGKADRGAVAPNGRAFFSGIATINFGNGTPSLAGVPFSVSASRDSLVLTINSTALSAAGLTAGVISIE
jgi:hypothetical protein